MLTIQKYTVTITVKSFITSKKHIIMRTHIEIKKIINQLDKKVKEHKRKIDIIKRIKYLIKTDTNETINTTKI